MDYDTLDTLLKAPETLYAGIATVGAVVGFYVGKLFYKNNLRHAEIRRDETLAREERKKLEIQLETAKLGDADNRHKRRLDLLAEERRYKVEDEDRERARRLEEDEGIKHEEDLKHQRRLEIARELASLRPNLEEYLDHLKTENPNLAEKKAAYAKELIDKFLDSVDGNYTNGIADPNNISTEDMENLRGLVEVAYPSFDSKIPPQLKRLIDLLNR